MTVRMLMLLSILMGCGPKLNSSSEGFFSGATADQLKAEARIIWELISGEFSNHEQVAQQRFRGEEPYLELHHVIVPIEMPRLGESVLFVQQTMKGSDKPYRTRLYNLVPDAQRAQVRMDIYKLADEERWHHSYTEPEYLRLLANQADIIATQGCSVFWSRTADGFKGSTDKGACSVWSERLQQTLSIQDDLTLNGEVLTIHDVAHDADGEVAFGHPDGAPHINRRMQYYKGWAVVRAGGPDYDRAAPEWRLHKGIQLHSEGSDVALRDESGETIPYRVELARLTRSASNTHLLKLAIVDVETDKTVAYTWTDPKAERVGINIGWAQVGLTREPVSPGLGHDSEETDPLVGKLSAYLSGELTSQGQSDVDEDFRAVRLRSCRVQAPGLGSTVLYVEQSLAEHDDAPYRQRLYRLDAGEKDGEVVSTIYTLHEPQQFVGTCDGKDLRKIHPSEAAVKAGCEVVMSFSAGVFHGKTVSGSCPSTLRGASYATAEVVVSAEGIDSLDRGYSNSGKQVWGSTKGAYEFRRMNAAD